MRHVDIWYHRAKAAEKEIARLRSEQHSDCNCAGLQESAAKWESVAAVYGVDDGVCDPSDLTPEGIILLARRGYTFELWKTARANMKTRTENAEAERDELRERVAPVMAFLSMMVAAYDTDPSDPMPDETEITSFCASGASGALTVGMVRKAFEAKP